MKDDSNTVPDRIRKLKALADDHRAPEGERAAARRKLEAALRAAGITEDQLSSDALIPWRTDMLDSLEKDLFVAVWHWLMEAKFTGMSWRRYNRQSGWFDCKTTAELMADIRAAFAWYLDYLNRDRRLLRAQARDIGRTIERLRQEQKLTRKAEKQLTSVMVGRYRIYHEATVEAFGAECSSNAAPAEPRKVSKAEKRRLNAEADAYGLACKNSTDGHRWQKPVGDLDGTQFQLQG